MIKLKLKKRSDRLFAKLNHYGREEEVEILQFVHTGTYAQAVIVKSGGQLDNCNIGSLTIINKYEEDTES